MRTQKAILLFLGQNMSPGMLNICHLTVLNEADLLGVAAETLPAAHEAVLPDQTMRVSTHATGAGSRAVVLRVRVPDV